MSEQLTTLSAEQWEFLAVLDAFGCPVSIDMAGALAPLLPGPLFDLIEKSEQLGWIKKIGKSRFAIAADLPPAARSRLNAINTPERLASLAERVYTEELTSGSDH